MKVSELARYKHLVKHFDQQLLKQFKERNYVIQKVQIESDIREDTQNEDEEEEGK